MNKAVLSNRIFLNCEVNSDLESELTSKLVYEISQEPTSPFPKIINQVTRVTPKIVSIPSAREDLIPSDYEIVDKRCYKSAKIPKPSFETRGQQTEAVDLIEGDNGLFSCPVSWGKTIAGLELAYRLQQKTLVITTTTMIRDMWVSEVEKWFGFKPGIVGGGKFNIDSPIVIGNIATIRNRLPKLAHEFGLILVDEVHRAPAETFTKTLNALYARYKVGLSGTLKRKDGMHVVLPDYFGTKRFLGSVENSMEPTVHVYQSEVELSANEFIPWAVKINNLMTNTEYLASIYDLTKSYVDAGHKVLIVADRTEFLETLHLDMEDESFLITGKVKGAELRASILQAVREFPKGVALFATQSIFSEGVSESSLSCVILATPINNEPLLEQIVGRVVRLQEGKLDPVVVDINLAGNTGKNHANSRKKTYINKGWKIRFMGTL